jgi:hydroxyethylthiazole kinase-like uncharacterized protein yjeF
VKGAGLPGLSPALVARLSKAESAHKYDHGHVLVLSGPAGRGGAARLAARAALRVGAGLVTLGAPPDALAEHAAQLTAIMLREVAGSAGLEALLSDARLNALCLGPGLGSNEQTRNLVRIALSARRMTVLDADALTAFEASPQSLFAVTHDNVVLTPHDGEFARLFPELARPLRDVPLAKAQKARRDAVHQAAARCGATVLLKGPATLIATPSGQSAEVDLTGDRAVPWLATAGSGDVLAGLICGLLARGFSPIQAAETGAGLHAAAARRFGPGLIAEDLPETLPGVFRALGL